MGKGDDDARPMRRGGSKVGTVHAYASQRRAPPELKYLFKRGKDTAGGETRDARAERVRRERDEARARRRAEAEARPRRPLREHPALKPAVIAAHVSAVASGWILKVGCGKIVPWTLALREDVPGRRRVRLRLRRRRRAQRGPRPRRFTRREHPRRAAAHPARPAHPERRSRSYRGGLDVTRSIESIAPLVFAGAGAARVLHPDRRRARRARRPRRRRPGRPANPPLLRPPRA